MNGVAVDQNTMGGRATGEGIRDRDTAISIKMGEILDRKLVADVEVYETCCVSTNTTFGQPRLAGG